MVASINMTHISLCNAKDWNCLRLQYKAHHIPQRESQSYVEKVLHIIGVCRAIVRRLLYISSTLYGYECTLQPPIRFGSGGLCACRHIYCIAFCVLYSPWLVCYQHAAIPCILHTYIDTIAVTSFQQFHCDIQVGLCKLDRMYTYLQSQRQCNGNPFM